MPLPGFSDAALNALLTHSWRGNVRELQNVVEHAVVLAEAGEPIGAEHLPFLNGDVSATVATMAGTPLPHQFGDEPYHPARERVIAEFELRYLTALVNRAEGNMSRAARIAGVDRTTLYRLMEKHGLQRETIMTGTGNAAP